MIDSSYPTEVRYHVSKRLDYKWQTYYEICGDRVFHDGDIEAKFSRVGQTRLRKASSLLIFCVVGPYTLPFKQYGRYVIDTIFGRLATVSLQESIEKYKY